VRGLPYSIHRYRGFADLSEAEVATLAGLGDAEVVRRKGETFQKEGEPVSGFHLHVQGWIASSILLHNGQRLIQKVHLPGDMLGTPSMVLPKAADTLTAITDAVTAFVPYQRFGQLYERSPRVAALFTIAVQMERLALMDVLAVTGNASAREQLARLLVDLHARLSPIGLVEDDGFDLPLTQEAIGDLLGLTSVHVNRTVRALEREGLIARSGHRIQLLDLKALQALSPLPPRHPTFNPAWLPSAR
jgi:CRP/FNR family transcriptional regulator, anaerobic regulatory protein